MRWVSPPPITVLYLQQQRPRTPPHLHLKSDSNDSTPPSTSTAPPLTAPERPRSPGSHAPPRRQARPRLHAPGHARPPPGHSGDPATRVIKTPALAATPPRTATTTTTMRAATGGAATACLKRQAGGPAYTLGDAVAHREHGARPAGGVAAPPPTPSAAPAVPPVDGGCSPEDVGGAVAGGVGAASAAARRPEVRVRQRDDLLDVVFREVRGGGVTQGQGVWAWFSREASTS